ncbi:hypothetical protein Tco_1090128 [Tanacetum coccineum]|uniref:Uncharacterized protein n=1 Tax=Tanacetum coccineum TaxID=301880 RepID=A0ABQ5I3G1_9ASTR
MEECHKLIIHNHVDGCNLSTTSASLSTGIEPGHVTIQQFLLHTKTCSDQFWNAEECKYDIAPFPSPTRRAHNCRLQSASYDIDLNLPDQAKIEMEIPRSSGVNSPPNAHT